MLNHISKERAKVDLMHMLRVESQVIGIHSRTALLGGVQFLLSRHSSLELFKDKMTDLLWEPVAWCLLNYFIRFDLLQVAEHLHVRPV